jgi:methionyl-tRNA synthetase
MKKFYLTTPLYYANARPHVGSAYSTLVCDTIARYKRLCGYDVTFLTGTDEYGENVERAATQLGLAPQELVDRNSRIFRDLWKLLGIEYTHFIRTTSPEHVHSVHKMIRRAQAAGYIYKGRYQGRYCVYDNLYVSDSTEPADCPTCGRPAELKDEENYFFKLSAFQDRLLERYEKYPEFVQPDFRRNEVKSFVKSGLRDISVSRKAFKWGVPWPDDPEHVVYVWYDALTGYLTGIGFAEGEQGSKDFQNIWPADLHLMAKEIIRFHAVYWPAFLMAADLPLPGTIFAHGWLLFEQDKMSKSKGNVVYCEPIVEVLGEVLGRDALRYYLLRDMTFGQDSNFSLEGLVQRFNSDLANDLGNLANRTVTMVNRYFGGEVPSAPTVAASRTSAGSQESQIQEVARKTLEQFCRRFDDYDFSRGLEAVWQLIASMNRYLVDEAPWVLAEAGFEANKSKIAAVLYTAAEAVRFSTVLLAAVIPQSAQRLWRQLGCEEKLEDQRLDKLKWGELKPGTRVGKPEPIFPRLDREPTLRKLRELEDAERAQAAPRKEAKKPVEPQAQQKVSAQPEKITIDDFAKVEMRVGEVLSAEPVPGAQRLLKLMVDIGREVRQVVAGIAEQYQPQQLVGMKVVLVANLQPRKLRGVESNGMVLAASVGEEGRPVLCTFQEDVPKGARLK